MKKLAMAMMLGVAALSANAQVNYRMQTACNPHGNPSTLPSGIPEIAVIY